MEREQPDKSAIDGFDTEKVASSSLDLELHKDENQPLYALVIRDDTLVWLHDDSIKDLFSEVVEDAE